MLSQNILTYSSETSIVPSASVYTSMYKGHIIVLKRHTLYIYYCIKDKDIYIG